MELLNWVRKHKKIVGTSILIITALIVGGTVNPTIRLLSEGLAEWFAAIGTVAAVVIVLWPKKKESPKLIFSAEFNEKATRGTIFVVNIGSDTAISISEQFRQYRNESYQGQMYLGNSVVKALPRNGSVELFTSSVNEDDIYSGRGFTQGVTVEDLTTNNRTKLYVKVIGSAVDDLDQDGDEFGLSDLIQEKLS